MARPVRDHGRDAVLDEVDMLDFLVAALQWLSNGEIHGFEVRLQQAEVIWRQAQENAVLGAELFRHALSRSGREHTTLPAVRAR
jgi:hypothetical protein